MMTIDQWARQARPVGPSPLAEAKERFERDYLIQLFKLTDGQETDAGRSPTRCLAGQTQNRSGTRPGRPKPT
jgi:hypothetical protein